MADAWMRLLRILSLVTRLARWKASSVFALSPMLQVKVGANPFVRVLVRADKQVRYEFMRGLLEAVGKSGVGNVTFSVADKEG